MGNHAEKNESEVKVNATGKSIQYGGVRWIRKDLYDRANEQINALYVELEVQREEARQLKMRVLSLED
jgi:hypothetical protein